MAGLVPPPPRLKQRQWGYVVWIVAGIFVAVPEITAAIPPHRVPWTTISRMVGHLEYLQSWVALVVIALIAFSVYSTVRFPADEHPNRTPGGRLTLQPSGEGDEDAREGASAFDTDTGPAWFALGTLVVVVLAVLAIVLTEHVWPDRPPSRHHYHQAYVLYGLIAVVWLVVPNGLALLARRDVIPFPTLFRTVRNLEDALRSRWHRWGPALASGISFVILWGLIVLLLHLTFYPFPNITHIVNPDGGS